MTQKERETLTKLREAALARMEKINEEIETIDHEFEAIRAYESVKPARRTQVEHTLKRAGPLVVDGLVGARVSRGNYILDLA
jgi:hypothetical protein